jgi:hypothetical protein
MCKEQRLGMGRKWAKKLIATRHPGHYIYHLFLDTGLAI